MYIDGHLDLASNVTVHRRDLTQKVMDVRREEEREKQELLVTLPELRRGGVGIVFGTLFTLPASMTRPPGSPPLTAWQKSVCYETPDEAYALAVAQLKVYEHWEETGEIRILRSQGDLEAHVEAWAGGDRAIGLVVLMEGADPIRTPAELAWWHDRGLRLVGPAWQRTRYAGGTGAPGPLTPAGKDLVRAMNEQQIPLDVSHLAEESFWDALALEPPVVFASHSNARTLADSDRHLTDAMIEALGERDGVIGIVLGNALLREEENGAARGSGEDPVTLDEAQQHAEHIAGLIGWDRVAIGSDFDGGFGVQETPLEITRGTDFEKLRQLAPAEAQDDVLGGTWLRFLRRALPA